MAWRSLLLAVMMGSLLRSARRPLLFVLLSALRICPAVSQASDTLRHELILDLEIRPRAEFRSNYQLTPADSIMPELSATQRNRLEITYRRRGLLAHASWQEIHLWGKGGQASAIGSINAYELYLEPAIGKNLSARIGRQGLSLDNGRIFSAAPWAQQCRAHEGVRFFFEPERLSMDLTVAFTRPYAEFFDPAYSPVASHQYKFLFVHHFKYRLSERFTVTGINAADMFEQTAAAARHTTRITNGGRLGYAHGGLAATLNAYYQYGRDARLKKIRAYYLQPEVSAKLGKATLRLGAEISGGESAAAPSDETRSFVPLYGVAWKFMGNMNFFTRFPADVDGRGLFNPYLFAIYQVNEQLSLRADGNLFYTQYPLAYANGQTAARYLGFESDLSFRYKPIKPLEVNFGFSFLLPERSMTLLRKVEDQRVVPVWSYLMVAYQLGLWHRRWTKG
jgi:hypothetical protein